MNNRRRFLSISAAAIGTGILTSAYMPEKIWRGRAFGADVSVTLKADPDQADEVITKIQKRLVQIDRAFSLYDQVSELSRLNREGHLLLPSQDFQAVLAYSQDIHMDSIGTFEPAVQSMWHALTLGEPVQQLGSIIDARAPDGTIILLPGMKLTFNGIAQGYASDVIHDLLVENQFHTHLVNIGEWRAGRGRWRLGVENQSGHSIGKTLLSHNAIATTSPKATVINGHSHLLSAVGRSPIWKTVSVQAESASIADGFSTAMSFLNEGEIREVLARRDDVQRVFCENDQGVTSVIV